MPAKNAIKEYEAGGYYHIYNRGVDKREIFLDEKDYKVFLSYLQFYLSPQIDFETNDLRGESSQVEGLLKTSPSKVLKNYCNEITLLAYCLMPNHFHLMIKQDSMHGIEGFMRSLSTKFVRYFNTRYKRIGPLFQGPYKAVKIENGFQYVYLSKYIHRNPLDIFSCEESPRRMGIEEYKYSSYGNYLGIIEQTWINTSDILKLFSLANKNSSYERFVNEESDEDLSAISSLTLDTF